MAYIIINANALFDFIIYLHRGCLWGFQALVFPVPIRGPWTRHSVCFSIPWFFSHVCIDIRNKPTEIDIISHEYYVKQIANYTIIKCTILYKSLLSLKFHSRQLYLKVYIMYVLTFLSTFTNRDASKICFQ